MTWSRRLTRLQRTIAGTGFALVLLVALAALDTLLNPARFSPAGWGTLIGLAGPLLTSSLASTPAILGGRGGIDVSIGPLMAFVNSILVAVLIGQHGIDSPWVLIPVAVLIGMAVGLVNGTLAAVVRVQPIVATLGTYLILTGLSVTFVPAPTGSIPPWFHRLSADLSFVPPLAIFVIWWGVRSLPYYGQLMAIGSDDRAAYTAGINVTAVRLLSYVITGVFGGIAALSLGALIGSADANVGPSYTLLAISATALGGIRLSGGRGGLFGAAIGAFDIFLLQSALTFFNVSTFVLQVAYGAILVLAVSSTALQERLLTRRDAA
jgi:ribose transport system permease protein